MKWLLSLCWFCWLPTLLLAAPTNLTNIQPDYLPDDKMAVLENLGNLSFPEWERFRILYGEKLIREGDVFLTVHEKCRRFAISLEGSSKETWILWAEEALRQRLLEPPISTLTLQKLRFRYPGTSLESVLQKEIARRKPPRVSLSPTVLLHVSMTQIQNAKGQTLFQDLLPEELWGTLRPSRVWDEKENPVREVRLDTSPWVFRMGTDVSIWPADEREMRPQGYLVALDMTADGRLLWLVEPESPQWAFVGTPQRVSEFFWVPMVELTTPRRFYLAAFDSQTGTQAARTFLFSADTEAAVLEIPLTANGTTLTVKVPGLEFHVSAETGQILEMKKE